MVGFQRQLRWTLRTGLVVGHQHYGAAVRCRFCPHKLINGHVRGHRRSLKMSEDDDVDEVPHQRVVFGDISARPTCTVVFVGNLCDLHIHQTHIQTISTLILCLSEKNNKSTPYLTPSGSSWNYTDSCGPIRLWTR